MASEYFDSSDYFTEKKAQRQSLPAYQSTAYKKPAPPISTLSKRWNSNGAKAVDLDRYNTARIFINENLISNMSGQNRLAGVIPSRR